MARLHRDAMAQYARDIVGGRLAPGDALPREVAVAERFGISRGIAREALRALEERGLITVRHGSSSTVNPRDEWDLFDSEVIAAALDGPAAVPLLGEYLECRRIIETEAAALAAERATPAQIDTMSSRLWEMEQALRMRPARDSERAYHEADVAFHAALVAATGNVALVSLVRRIDDALLAARYPLARPAARRARAFPEHAEILAAVRAHDPERARTAVRTHLDTVAEYLRQHARRVARAA